MKLTKVAITTLLFCVFPGRLLILWMPMLGLSYLASFLAQIEYICIFYLIIQSFSFRSQTNKTLYLFYVLYVIYSVYLIYYIIINPQIPRDRMLAVPVDNYRVYQELIIIGIICFLTAKFHEYVNFVRFSKISAIVLYGILLIYVLTQKIAIYTIVRSLEDNLLADYGLISALVLGRYVVMAYFFSLWAKDSWSKNKDVNNIINILTFLSTFVILLILTQRGPMLFFFLSLLFYYYARYKIRMKVTIPILLIITFLYVFFDDIAILIKQISPEIVNRFISIQEDGGSGRFGDENSLYTLAIQQISGEPIFGTYFRIMTGSGLYGSYPHNFVLELLMTFGCVCTIPFMWLVLIAWNKSYQVVQKMSPIGIFAIIFIYIYLTLLTSHSIAFDVQVWCSLAMVLSVKYPTNKIWKIKNINFQS